MLNTVNSLSLQHLQQKSNVQNNRQNVAFGYKVFVDSGASDPKRGSFKVSIRSEESGKEIFTHKEMPSDYCKVGPKGGFKTADDYVNGLASRISKAIDMAKGKIAELKGDDKNLSGVLINAPAYVIGGKRARFVANLKDQNNESLRNVDFTKIDIDTPKNDDKYRLIATNDMHGAAFGVAKILKEQGKLKDGFYGFICMTGGGMGVVTVKVKNGMLEVEGSENGHNQVIGKRGVHSMEKAAASAPGLITNFAQAMKYPPEKVEELVNAGNAIIVSEAYLNGTPEEKRAAGKAIGKYVDTISQEFARKVLDGCNTVIVSGPLANGIKKDLEVKTGNPDELKDRIMKRIQKHLPETSPGTIMADIHNFDLDIDMDIPDNTVGGAILLDHAQFIGGDVRGNWLEVPVDKL